MGQDFPQFVRQSLGGEGFLEQRYASLPHAWMGAGIFRAGGGEENFYLRGQGPQAAGQFHAGHVRQREVGEQQIDGAGAVRLFQVQGFKPLAAAKTV
jgi:hypothetical protein